MFALSTANQMAPHVGKKQKKPKELKLFNEKKGSGERSEKVVDIAQHKRAKSALAASRARVPWGSESG